MSTADGTQYKPLPTKEKYETDAIKIPEAFGYGVRHIQTLIVFTSLAVAFVARGHFSLTIVAMTDQAPNTHSNETITKDAPYNHSEMFLENKTHTENVILENVAILEEVNEEGTLYTENITSELTKDSSSHIFSVYKIYQWPKAVQEMVLSSFFVGYCIMMLPMGMVCQRWGGKLPIQIALSVNGVVSILTPHLAAWGGWKAVSACRLVQGLSQAGFYPSIQTLVTKWAPPSERGRLSSYVYMGSVFGTILAFQVGGALAATRWGWPLNFWTTGGLCLVMFAIVTIFGAATPLDHKSISEEERSFIIGNSSRVKKTHKIPWKALLSTKAVWASICAQFGCGLSFSFFFIQVPTYIHYILGVDVKSSGVLSSLPYVGGFISSIVFGILSDFFTNKKLISIRNARRVSNTIAHVGLSASLVMVSFTKNVQLAVSCLVFALTANAGVHTGWMVNHMDLAPNYTGTLMTLGNTVCNGGYFMITGLVSVIVTDMTNQYQWRIMFLFIASLAFFSNAIFVVFMSSTVQPWNDSSEEKTDTISETKESTVAA